MVLSNRASALTDVFLPNEQEARLISRTSNVEDAVRVFQEMGVAITAIKQGEAGAQIVTKGDAPHLQPACQHWRRQHRHRRQFRCGFPCRLAERSATRAMLADRLSLRQGSCRPGWRHTKPARLGNHHSINRDQNPTGRKFIVSQTEIMERTYTCSNPARGSSEPFLIKI